jgi:hypothetical protein
MRSVVFGFEAQHGHGGAACDIRLNPGHVAQAHMALPGRRRLHRSLAGRQVAQRREQQAERRQREQAVASGHAVERAAQADVKRKGKSSKGVG